MRLLLRANAHRPVDAGLEVAASPDTPTRPEPWRWNLRLLDGLPGDGAAAIALETDSPWAALVVDTDPTAVRPDVSVVTLDGTCRVERPEDDLLALVVTSGSALIEGRHALAPGDAMVLTGEDPLSVDATGTDGTMILVRLSSSDGSAVAWVP